MTTDITLTDSAAKRILAMRQQDNNPNLMLRLRVDAGGCSGFSYVFSFESSKNADDLLFEHNGASAIIDPVSMELLRGARIDYVEELIGSYFSVKNPNASSGCGCGMSFGI